MKLFEYQAKEIFREAGIPVPQGQLIGSAEEGDRVASSVELPVMMKAQVLAGGRGKAGLIQRAGDPQAVRDTLGNWIGRPFGGETVKAVLLETPLDIENELYLSVTIDPAAGSPLLIASAAGGVDIEELSRDRPDAVLREPVHIFRGLRSYQARWVVERLGLQGEQAKSLSRIIHSTYDLFRSLDAELVEINPLVVDKVGSLWAADAKIRIDDNALFRQKRFSKGREHFEDDIEYEAFCNRLSYVRLDGDIGVLCTGAGLTMTTLDLIQMAGGRAANFLEFGGATYRNAAAALGLALKNPRVKVLLIVTFGLVARADVIAEGLVEAIKELKPEVPMVTAVRGTGEERARELIRSIGIESLDDTEEAVKKAVQLAKG